MASPVAAPTKGGRVEADRRAGMGDMPEAGTAAILEVGTAEAGTAEIGTIGAGVAG